MDLAKARRPGREVQRVNVDFPKTFLAGSASLAITIVIFVSLSGSSKTLYALFDLNGRFAQTTGFVQERADAGETGLKQLVAEALAPRSIGHLLLWSPLRPIIWFYLPYPLLNPSLEGITAPPTLLYEERLAKVRAIHDQAFMLTGWLLILATPFLLGACWSILHHKTPGLRVLIFNIAASALLIGNLMFIMGRRYRTLIEPLVLAVVLVAIHYKLGRKLMWPVWLTMFSGVALVALFR